MRRLNAMGCRTRPPIIATKRSKRLFARGDWPGMASSRTASRGAGSKAKGRAENRVLELDHFEREPDPFPHSYYGVQQSEKGLRIWLQVRPGRTNRSAPTLLPTQDLLLQDLLLRLLLKKLLLSRLTTQRTYYSRLLLKTTTQD